MEYTLPLCIRRVGSFLVDDDEAMCDMLPPAEAGMCAQACTLTSLILQDKHKRIKRPALYHAPQEEQDSGRSGLDCACGLHSQYSVLPKFSSPKFSLFAGSKTGRRGMVWTALGMLEYNLWALSILAPQCRWLMSLYLRNPWTARGMHLLAKC